MLKKILFLCLWSTPLWAQLEQSTNWGLMTGIRPQNAFWLRSNQWGMIPDSGTNVYVQHQMVVKNIGQGPIKYQAGLDVVALYGKEGKVVLPEAYLQARWKKIQLLAGRKKQIHGFVDTTMSSGSFSWSGNALPIPEVQLSIPDYIPFLKKWIQIKGHYSHGWFFNQQYVRNYYLHQKAFYVKWGNERFHLVTGMLHHAQWGGTPKYEIEEDRWKTINNRFAEGWRVYPGIVFPLKNPPHDSSNVASFDFENKYGNHLGQIDLGGTWNHKNFSLTAYKQLPFETGQTFSSLGNLDDGLYGLSLHLKNPEMGVQKITFEVLHTTNQGLYRSGLLKLLGFKGRHYGRNQNFYFNHFQYLDGWAYEQKTIGTSFLQPNANIRNEKAHGGPANFANNNNVKAVYLALQSKFQSITLRNKFSYSRNYGTEPNPFLKAADQFSMLHSIEYQMPKSKNSLSVQIAVDHGDLIYDNYGIGIVYKKAW